MLAALAIAAATLCSRSWGAIWYCKHNASGGGTGTTASPFQPQEAADNGALAAGDTIVILNTGTYATTATWDIDTTAGTIDNWILVVGATAGNVIDGTRATLDAVGAGGGFVINITVDYWHFRNLRITGSTGTAHGTDGGVNANGSADFTNCRFDNHGEDGIYCPNSGDAWKLTYCELDNNGDAGWDVNSTNARGKVMFVDCYIHDNTTYGVHTGGGNAAIQIGCFVINCIVADNNIGVSVGDPSEAMANFLSVGSTYYSNASHAIELSDEMTSQPLIVQRNIFANNGGYGIEFNGATPTETFILDYNTFSNNATGNVENLTATAHGTQNTSETVTFVGAPGNLTIASGADKDITLPGHTGIGHPDPGAVQRVISAGDGDAFPFPGIWPTF